MAVGKLVVAETPEPSTMALVIADARTRIASAASFLQFGYSTMPVALKRTFQTKLSFARTRNRSRPKPEASVNRSATPRLD